VARTGRNPHSLGRRDPALVCLDEREELVGGVLSVVATFGDLADDAGVGERLQAIERPLMRGADRAANGRGGRDRLCRERGDDPRRRCSMSTT
jgi:hypothetical protein